MFSVISHLLVTDIVQKIVGIMSMLGVFSKLDFSYYTANAILLSETDLMYPVEYKENQLLGATVYSNGNTILVIYCLITLLLLLIAHTKFSEFSDDLRY